ncbi:MAG: ABC transporter substrate-binding protein [Microcystaceae cyanobacterium]
MTQKKETLILLMSLGITLGLVGAGAWIFLKPSGPPNPPSALESPPTPLSSQDILQQSSYGEKLLIPTVTNPAKTAGITAFAQGNFPQAIAAFEQALKLTPNDPETVIYLNNAKIGNQSVAFVASVPIGKDINASQELLRGVAQAQTAVNAQGGINGVPLKILIADDKDDTNIAQQLAQAWVKDPAILAVIGHFGSNTTLAAAKNVYQPQGLPMISPTSTTVELSELGDYIFRTVPSDLFAGNALADYLLKTLKKTKVAVFYNSESNYSKSLKNVFTTAVLGNGGEVVAEFDFSAPGFNPVEAVKQAQDQGAQALLLAMNTAVLDKALLVIQANQGKLPLLGGDSAYKPEILQVGGQNAVGMVVAIPWHALAHQNSPFLQQAGKLWRTNNVNWRTAMAYDATQSLIKALKQNPSRQGIQAALSDPSFTAAGATGTIRFLPSGDHNQPVQLVEVVPGKRSGFGFDFIPISR